jgi:hypothetical protein
MEIQNRLDLNELAPIYLHANTPMYLFTRFRGSSTLYQATAPFSPEELIEEYNRIASKPKKKGEEVVFAYALLISLAYRNQIEGLLDKVDLDGLDWAPHIVQILKDTSQATASVCVESLVDAESTESGLTTLSTSADDSVNISLSPSSEAPR